MAACRVALLRRGLAKRTVELVFQLVEDAVDEAFGVEVGEQFGEVDSLINRHDRRDVTAVKDLINGEPKD